MTPIGMTIGIIVGAWLNELGWDQTAYGVFICWLTWALMVWTYGDKKKQVATPLPEQDAPVKQEDRFMDRLEKNKQKGFTLIEVMIVVAIVGILLTVVVGSYKDSKSGNSNQPTVQQPQRMGTKNSGREYINNSIRDNSTQVEIKTHTDGTKYACIVGGNKCYRVK